MDKTFSWTQQKLDAIVTKQRIARTQARNHHSDMKLKHPDWCRDASGDHPNYTVMDKKIKETVEKLQLRNETFQRKLHESAK